ncbi:MAG: hypothetical protein PHX38_11125 [Sulfuricella sp.]|nr:hypothetical protein [Sulfuricella sp.]
MRPIDIDFGGKRRTRARIFGIFLLAATIAGVGAQTWAYFGLRAEAEASQADRRRLDRLASAPSIKSTPEDQERLRAELQLSNRIIDKLDMPWDALFATVEATANKQAILLGVEPDAERREVRLTGEAKDAAAMLGYLRELRRASALKNAYLTDHQVNIQDPQRPVRFAIDASWVAPALKEPAAAPPGKSNP